MLLNYLTITLRNLRRQPGYSFINIAGLATGMAAFVLIALFVQNELSFDRDNPNRDDTYRVILDARVAGQEILTVSSPAVMSRAFLEAFPE
jgi:putative ABC transport system permease protein